MTAPRIVVVGSSNTDMVIRSERLPERGETVLGGDFLVAPGGKGANQAVAAARLGAQVTLVARVGADDLGDRALAGYRDEGIDTRFAVRDPEASSGVALILVDTAGENLISVAPGANARLAREDVEEAAEAIRDADLLLLQLEIPLAVVEYAARLAHQAGVPVVLDPAPAATFPDELLARIEVLTPNAGEAERLTGEAVGDERSAAAAAATLRQRGVRQIVVTLGAAGVWIDSSDGARHLPARRVEAVDTTAAGDAFNGALAVALAEGQKLLDAATFATAAAALSVTRAGAQPSLPRRGELRALFD